MDKNLKKLYEILKEERKKLEDSLNVTGREEFQEGYLECMSDMIKEIERIGESNG